MDDGWKYELLWNKVHHEIIIAGKDIPHGSLWKKNQVQFDLLGQQKFWYMGKDSGNGQLRKKICGQLEAHFIEGSP